jgi:translation elongation factor EF-Tu-like GTPase
MHRSHDIEGEFYIFAAAQSGRRTPAYSGYRPQHKIHDNYQTSGQHEYLNATQVAPGETVSTKIWLLTPDVYPNSLWVGRKIGVFEGARQVGTFTVSRIVNDVLLGSPETYNPVWAEPPGLDAHGRKIVG